MSYEDPPRPPAEGGYPPPPPAYTPPPTTPEPPRGRRLWPWIVGGLVLVLVVVAGIVGATAGSDITDTADRPDATVTPPGSEPSEDTPTTAAETTEPAGGVPDAARSYFEAMASQDLSRMGAMLDVSQEGSPAALYAVHQIANVRALGTGFGTEMNEAGDTITLTTVTGYANDGTEQTETTTFSGFTGDGGKLSGFHVNDAPVADRIRAGGDPVAGDGVTVRVVTAYQTALGDLFLNVDTTNGRQGVMNISSYEWALVTPDGRQVSPSQKFCCTTDPVIQPGATAGTMVAFEQVGLGGTLRFVAFADDFVTEVRFDVPVPA